MIAKHNHAELLYYRLSLSRHCKQFPFKWKIIYEAEKQTGVEAKASIDDKERRGNGKFLINVGKLFSLCTFQLDRHWALRHGLNTVYTARLRKP